MLQQAILDTPKSKYPEAPDMLQLGIGVAIAGARLIGQINLKL